MKVWGKWMEVQTESVVGTHGTSGPLTREHLVLSGDPGERRFSGQTASAIGEAG